MSLYYLDASALVKRYVDEVGSVWLRKLVDPARSPLVFTSRMTIAEVSSALARRARDGSLTPAEFAAVRDAFRGDCLTEYRIMPPTMPVIDRACTLLEQYPLRAYDAVHDAVHLATALEAQRFLAAHGYPALTFLSADDQLNRAAAAEGVAVDDPNQHP